MSYISCYIFHIVNLTIYDITMTYIYYIDTINHLIYLIYIYGAFARKRPKMRDRPSTPKISLLGLFSL